MGMMWASCLNEVPEVLAVRPDLRDAMREYFEKESASASEPADMKAPFKDVMIKLLEGDMHLDEAVMLLGGASDPETGKRADCLVKCTFARLYNLAVLDRMESQGLSRAIVCDRAPDNVASPVSSQLTGKGYYILMLRKMLSGGEGPSDPICLVKGNPLCKFVVMPVTGV
jgi:hypothetical protein